MTRAWLILHVYPVKDENLNTPIWWNTIPRENSYKYPYYFIRLDRIGLRLSLCKQRPGGTATVNGDVARRGWFRIFVQKILLNWHGDGVVVIIDYITTCELETHATYMFTLQYILISNFWKCIISQYSRSWLYLSVDLDWNEATVSVTKKKKKLYSYIL